MRCDVGGAGATVEIYTRGGMMQRAAVATMKANDLVVVRLAMQVRIIHFHRAPIEMVGLFIQHQMLQALY